MFTIEELLLLYDHGFITKQEFKIKEIQKAKKIGDNIWRLEK